MTLLEILVVLAIAMLAASGVSFSLGALARTNLKGAAGKIASAVRFAYNRAITHGRTVRIHFTVPGGAFSIEEAHSGVTLARSSERQTQHGAPDEDEQQAASVDPWAAAKARLEKPLEPTLGASPFGAIENAEGKPNARYTAVPLGRGVQIVKLIVGHEPEPLTDGDGAIHFFAGGRTEHAVLQLGDGRSGVYSVEVHPLTGRVRIHPKEFEPQNLLDDPESKEAASEVEEP